MAVSSDSQEYTLTVVFQPTERSLENDDYWPKVLTAIPVGESILVSMSGYFKHLPQQGTVFIDLLLREYEHTITLPLRLYESFRLIFNAIQRYGTRMPRKLKLSGLSFTQVALLNQGAAFLKISELEGRLRGLLENWEISDTEVHTLLASVPVDDLAVKLLINNLARLYMHSLQCEDSDTTTSIKELLRRARSPQFTQMFKHEIKRRQARDCECKKEYCCGEQGCCIHAERSGQHVAEDRDDGDPDDADKAGRVSYERERPVQRDIRRQFRKYDYGNEHQCPTELRHEVNRTRESKHRQPSVVSDEESVSSTRATISTRNSHRNETKTTTTATSRQSSGTARSRRRRSSVLTSQASTFVPSSSPPSRAGSLSGDSIRPSQERPSASAFTAYPHGDSRYVRTKHKRFDPFDFDIKKDWRGKECIVPKPGREEELRNWRKQEKSDGESGWTRSWSHGWCRAREGKSRRRKSKSIDIDDISGGLCCIFF